MGATATKTLHEVEFRDVGSSIHITAEPELPDAGVILDATGKELVSTRGTGWMVRADTKASEKIELSKWMIFMLSTFPALGVAVLMLVFNYGSSIMGWTREDQEVRTKVEIMSKSVDELNRKFDEIQKILQVQALKDAEKRGYELKAAEGDHGGK